MRGVIVFAHGSRDPLWRSPVEAIADQIRAIDPQAAASCAYLELCEPDLPTAAQRLIEQGISDVRVLPLFFGMGKHAREDLPVLMQQLRDTHPGVAFTLLPTAGENPRLTALMAQMALED